MIEKLINYSHKSFKNYTGPDVPFKKRNVIFGYNGKGKTSLARGIEKAFLDSEDENSLRYYNQDYITSNLRIGETNNLKGVKAVFGKTNIDVDERIKILTKSIKSTDDIEKKTLQLKNDCSSRINAIFDSLKGTAKIARKNLSSDVNNLLVPFVNDLKEAKKIINDDNQLAEIKGDNSLERNLENTRTLQIPSISFTNFGEERVERLISVSSKKYSSDSIPKASVVDWIKKGLALHKQGDSCFFCGNKNLNYNDIKQKLDEYEANEKQEDAIFLNAFKSEFDTIARNLEQIKDNKSTFAIFLGDEINETLKNIDELINYFENIAILISEKIEDMESIVDIDYGTLKDEITESSQIIEFLMERKKEKIENLEKQYSKQDKLVKGSIALKVLSDQIINKNIEDIKENEKQLALIESDNKKIYDEIRDLKMKKTSTGDFAAFISEVLHNLEIDLKLGLDGEDYVLLSTREENCELKISDISEGEKNLLSLLFFYYELFSDKEQKHFKTEIKMIIVDDPIYSVDDINKMFILSLLDSILKLEAPQVFVFTHIWEDFNDLLFSNDPERNAYEIIKGETSSLRSASRGKTPYHHDFNEIYLFSQKRSEDIGLDDECFYHMPNTIRRVLEYFMSFKLSGNPIPTANNLNNIKKVLFKDPDKINTRDQSDLAVLIKICNVNSHKSARHPDELVRAAKFLMRRVNDVDKTHFDSMKTF